MYRRMEIFGGGGGHPKKISFLCVQFFKNTDGFRQNSINLNPLGNSVKSDVHFGHFQGLDIYCQWGHLGFKVCMMCRGTSTIITLIIRVTPCFILEKCVKNTMVLDVRAQKDFFRLSCSCSKLCDVWGLTLKLIPVLIAWSIGLYNIHKHYL